MEKQDIIKLITEVENLRRNDLENVVYIDALERLHLADFLFEKFKNSAPSFWIFFTNTDWELRSIPVEKLKSFLRIAEARGIISSLVFGLPGSGNFKVVEKSLFVKYIEAQINEVEQTLRKSGDIASERVDKLLAFLSYSSKNKILAGNIKENLEKYDIDVFLAHEDIEPSEEWQNTIIEKLNQCSIFIPLLTEDFRISKFTDQETGAATILGKVIIPLKIDVDPYGFIAKIQGLKFDELKLNTCCSSIIKKICDKFPAWGHALLQAGLITIFMKSSSFRNAEENAKLLEPCLDLFDAATLEKICDSILTNRQIYDASNMPNMLKTWFHKVPYFKSAFEKSYKMHKQSKPHFEEFLPDDIKRLAGTS